MYDIFGPEMPLWLKQQIMFQMLSESPLLASSGSKKIPAQETKIATAALPQKSTYSLTSRHSLLDDVWRSLPFGSNHFADEIASVRAHAGARISGIVKSGPLRHKPEPLDESAGIYVAMGSQLFQAELAMSVGIPACVAGTAMFV